MGACAGGHSLHRGHCYGANGGDAESHHNCGGSCRNVHVKTNPYQCEAGYGNYTGRHPDDEDTDDGGIYMTGPTCSKANAKTHYFHAQLIDEGVSSDLLNEQEQQQQQQQQQEQQQQQQPAKCAYLAEEELASDYDEDIPPIDLSKAISVESFGTRVRTEQSVNAEGMPVTVTTIL